MSIKQYIVANIDKVVHFLAGMVVGQLLYAWPYAALIVIVSLALGKELSDKLLKNGTVDKWDAIWTILGGILGIIAQTLIG